MKVYRDKVFWFIISVVLVLLQIMCIVMGKNPPPELSILFFITIGVLTILSRLDFLLEDKITKINEETIRK
jgi:predicted membrane channel-forming protein YqfA (hemolysin III family)